MSFSKAKVQRFNDVKVNPTPVLPPARKPPSLHLHKSKCSSSESSLEKTPSEGSSVKGASCFKQPLLTVKKKTCLKPKPATYSKETIELEALKEKIVECQNKDVTIKELREFIEELQEKAAQLEKQKIHLGEENAKYEEAIAELNKEYNERAQKLMETFHADLSEAKAREDKIKKDIELFKEEYEVLKRASKNDVENLKSDIHKLDKATKELLRGCNEVLESKAAELAAKEVEYKKIKMQCAEINEKYSEEMGNIKREHQLEIQDLEYEMLKLVTELQKERESTSSRINEMQNKFSWELENMRNSYENEKQNILFQTSQQIKELQEKCYNEFFETALEEKVKAVEIEWQGKLASQQKEAEEILKECQAISEYNIIQSEVEKNKIKKELEEKSLEVVTFKEKFLDTFSKYEELKSNYRKIEIEFSKVVLELNDARKDLGEQLECQQHHIVKLTKERQAFEVTTKNLQTTIDVLTKRLIHSDGDVEQLKQELAECEEKLLKYEQKCLQLNAEVKQAQNFAEELEMQYESTIKLNKSEINQVSSDLCRKVDSYQEHVKEATKNLEEERNLKKEIMQQLHDTNDMILKMKTEMECFEALNSQYEFEIEQSLNELENYRMKEMEWNINRERLEEHIAILERKLEWRQEELEELRNKVKHQEEVHNFEKEEEETIYKKYIQMSGKYDRLLQGFEELENENVKKEKEIIKLTHRLKENEAVAEKYDILKGEHEKLLITVDELKKSIESDAGSVEGNELKDISQKLNQQNNKHEMKNDEAQNNFDLNSKLRAYLKTIEKLKKDNSELRKHLKKSKFDKENKENVASPNRSLNNSKVESPFRDRN